MNAQQLKEKFESLDNGSALMTGDNPNTAVISLGDLVRSGMSKLDGRLYCTYVAQRLNARFRGEADEHQVAVEATERIARMKL